MIKTINLKEGQSSWDGKLYDAPGVYEVTQDGLPAQLVIVSATWVITVLSEDRALYPFLEGSTELPEWAMSKDLALEFMERAIKAAKQ